MEWRHAMIASLNPVGDNSRAQSWKQSIKNCTQPTRKTLDRPSKKV
jgi:hypothetical protein